MLGSVCLSNTTIVVLDKYTHPNIFIAKHNVDDITHDFKWNVIITVGVTYYCDVFTYPFLQIKANIIMYFNFPSM